MKVTGSGSPVLIRSWSKGTDWMIVPTLGRKATKKSDPLLLGPSGSSREEGKILLSVNILENFCYGKTVCAIVNSKISSSHTKVILY